MTPLPTSRSSFDKASLHEVINRYGWSKNPPASVPQVREATPAVPAPAPNTVEPGLSRELETARAKIVELTEALTQKDEQLEVVSQQCEDLKQRGDDFEKTAFQENAAILKLKAQLEEKDRLLSGLEEQVAGLRKEISTGEGKSQEASEAASALEQKLKEAEERHQREIEESTARILRLEEQLKAGDEAVAKYKHQAKQGADLLKQSIAECQRLELELKNLQARISGLEKEKSELTDQLVRQEASPKAPTEDPHRIQELENEIQALHKRVQDAEAHAANSQAAVSHAMDFAYKATQDNEFMKKKLHEAGIRI